MYSPCTYIHTTLQRRSTCTYICVQDLQCLQVLYLKTMIKGVSVTSNTHTHAHTHTHTHAYVCTDKDLHHHSNSRETAHMLVFLWKGKHIGSEEDVRHLLHVLPSVALHQDIPPGHDIHGTVPVTKLQLEGGGHGPQSKLPV